MSTRSVISSIIAGMAASSATVTAARTRSASISSGLCAGDQRLDGFENQGSFEGLAQDRVATGAHGLRFVERLEQAGGEHDSCVAMAWMVLDETAEVQAALQRQKNV
jgi:hypothetical protein